ncbi:MAG: S1/P1 nuclease [Flavobacteriaceae bacterium]
MLALITVILGSLFFGNSFASPVSNCSSSLAISHEYNTSLWGQTGHRVVGRIAEQHLNKRAQKAIRSLLEGYSLAYASTIADEIKSDKAYDAYGPWHYVNFDMDKTYDPSSADDRGDIVYGIQKCIEVLSNKQSSESDKSFHLKLLIHFIGDLHQPLHVGRSEDQGGNRIQVSWFSRNSNLHRVWDSDLIDGYNMSYEELAQELMRSTEREEIMVIQEGNYLDWVEESHQMAKVVYASATSGGKLSYRYGYDYNPMVFEQLKKGGYRLAKILNEIFN